MRFRFWLIEVLLVLTCVFGASAQETHSSASPRDFEGIWTNSTLTPLERPTKFVDRHLDGDERVSPLSVSGGLGEKWTKIFAAGPTLSDVDAEAYEKANRQNLDVAVDARKAATAKAEVDEAYNTLFIDKGENLTRIDGKARTSLIVDPEDGKVPPLTPEGKIRSRMPSYTSGGSSFDSVKLRPLSERCIVGFGPTGGPPMLPVLYNNNYQIIQTTQTIVIMIEMIHDVRYIHMDRTQHLPGTIRLLLGDSIGHWEGDTLVVDTTNFTDQTRFRGASESLHIVERLRRLDANTFMYQATMDDSSTFARPWTIEYPFRKTPGPVFEYACHEGNYALTDIMGGARKQEGGAKSNAK